MNDPHDEDPFSPAADPDLPARRIDVRTIDRVPRACHCAHARDADAGPSLTRRQALLGVGALTLLPIAAAADPFPAPCVQDKQKIQPCRHKFCRHYAGEGDYYGR